jgi:hypothetical protein
VPFLTLFYKEIRCHVEIEAISRFIRLQHHSFNTSKPCYQVVINVLMAATYCLDIIIIT